MYDSPPWISLSRDIFFVFYPAKGRKEALESRCISKWRCHVHKRTAAAHRGAGQLP